MPIAAPPVLVAPAPAIQVLEPYRAAPRFQPGGRRVLLLAAQTGDPVRAPCTGRVRFRGQVAGRPPVLTIDCAGGRGRVTVSRLRPQAQPGSVVVAGARIGAAAGSALGLSVRRAGLGYVDPLPLLRVATAPDPPAVAARRPGRPRGLPTVRLDRPVRTLEAAAPVPDAARPLGADRWLGGIGSVLGLGALGWWLHRRRRQPSAVLPRAAVHPAGPRR